MADLPDIKRQVQGSSAQMPPPPAPGPDDDLPAPAPPQGQANDIPDAPTPVEGGKEKPEQKPQAAKEAEQKPAPAPMPQPRKEQPKQQAPGMDIRQAVPKPASREAYEAAEEAADVSSSPPVFIKIDKYAEMVRQIRKLKSYAMNLRDALDALNDIEKEISTGIAISHKALDDFNNVITMLDSRLSRTTSIKEVESSDNEEIDNYIKGIYDQMERIKGELSNIQ